MENSNQAPQVQEVQSQTPLPVNSSKSKLIPIILGVAAVIVIAIGAYLLGTKQPQPVTQNSIQTTPIPSPTPIDETVYTEATRSANWKTYIDKRTGVTFRYPNWRITKEDDSSSKLTVEFEILGSIYTFERITTSSIPKDLQSSTAKTKNGITWIIAKGELKYKCATKECKVYSTMRNGYIYSLYTPSDTPELVDQILSTFKFTQ